MPAPKPGLSAIMKKIKQGPQRTPLFHYLVEHHDRLLSMAAGKKVPWSEIVEMLVTEIGEPVTEAIARKTWWRAKRAVERERSYKAEARAARTKPAQADMPSRFPMGRQPLEYTRAPSPSPKPAEPSGPTSPTDRTPAQARADAQIARMKRHFAERDGRKPPS
jgi:hypothetical protein